MKYRIFELEKSKIMIAKSKLKGPIGRVYPIAMLLTYIFVVIELLVRNNIKDSGGQLALTPYYSVLACAAFFVVMGIVQFIKYKLWVFLFLGILIGISTWLSTAHYHYSVLTVEMYLVAILVVILFIVINWSVLYSQEKLNSNARRLFKLAVDIVDEVSEGYTKRPYSVGKMDYRHDELHGFIRFLSAKYIGTSFHLKNITYTTFSLGTSTLRISDPMAVSNISFDDNGNIAVYICEYDYKQYKQQYSFDQICTSMGEVFIRFFNYYKDGNEQRIIDELKSVKY